MKEIERQERARVAAEARSWIGTPYRHGGRIKGAGADCTFFAVLYEELGLIPHVDVGFYSPQFALHRNEELYLEKVLEHAHETMEPGIGDVVVYRWGRVYSHGGIIIDPGWPSIVHAEANVKFVIAANGEHARIGKQPRKFFTIWPRR